MPAITRFPLSIGLYLLRFRLLDEMLLPAVAGHVWRSVIGMQLKRMSTGQAPAPADLPIPVERLYSWFMETPPPEDAKMMRRYPHAPHPYVLACDITREDRRLPAGAELALPLRLFGKGNGLLSAIILSCMRAAAGGLGKWRSRARLLEVLQAPAPHHRQPAVIFRPGEPLRPLPPWCPHSPEMPTRGRVMAQLETPLRLVSEGHVITPSRLDSPYLLLMNLVRRASMLCAFHGEGELSADYRALKESARKARLIGKDLQWQEQRRYSARSKSVMPLGGLVGRMELDLSAAPELWPFLWLGQWIHAGKSTVLGLGRYELRPA